MNELTTAQGERFALGFAITSDWKTAADDWLNNFGSDRTRRTYREALSAFLGFAQKPPATVSQSDVITYRRFMETGISQRTGRPYTQATINLHLSAVASFFDFAQEARLRSDNPTDGVKRKAVTPYGKATYLDPETRQDVALLNVIDASTDQGKRDKAIMLLFLTAALRVSEVASLTVGALRRQGDKAFMTYTRKRGETAEVELAAEAAHAIDDYLKTRPGLQPSSPLFVATAQGRRAASHLLKSRGLLPAEAEGPLTSRAIANLVRAYCDKVFGPGHGIHPHSLRHTAAQVAIAEGLSVTEVSRLLKHRSLRVTTIYLHATDNSDAKVAGKMSRRYAGAA